LVCWVICCSTAGPRPLTGALLRDVTLASANLTGVIADYASFFSSSSGTADAGNTTMTGARWSDARLAGADFSDAVLQSTVWDGAVLVGANFNGADLSKNTTAGEVTDFEGAFLQGAVFTDAQVTDANFTSSYWDLGDGSLNVLLQPQNLEFVGYWNDPGAAECVQANYPSPNYPSPATPVTTVTNDCPDGNTGPCDEVWTMPSTPIDQAIPATAPHAPLRTPV